MPGPRRRARASLSAPPGPCRRAAESRRPPPCPRPAADLKVRGTITSPVPPRNRSTSHQDDRPRTSRHDRQTLPDPPRTGTSTYPPNMNLPLSHPSELHPQKNGRKARPRRKSTSTSKRPPHPTQPTRRDAPGRRSSGTAAPTGLTPAAPHAHAPYAHPMSRSTFPYEIDGDTANLIRQCQSRRGERPRELRPTRPSARHDPAHIAGGQVQLDRQARQSRGTPPTTSPESPT